ncbi:bacteriocin fulvocin C-related protein [Streptosporangium jomthongense]|uniref:Bacteriocin fulvocin C-related protein n=1 Tax=Streptosporangium jomthongense TaxID=1193683 RepID=A0ABV8F0P2_9ACTN
MSLANPEVHQWREQNFGAEPPWVPTLIRVREGRVRAWTGLAMGTRLARLLGPRSTARLLRAFGEMRRGEWEDMVRREATDRPVGGAIGRSRFLKLAAGAGVAAGLILAGKTPAFAQSEYSAAAAWVNANRHRLPERYADFVAYSIVYRQSIFAALSPKSRSKLWSEHLKHYRLTHPNLSAEQLRVIELASVVLAAEATFIEERDADVDRKLLEIQDAAVAVFGKEEARRLIAVLGPEDSSVGLVPDCECSTLSDYYCAGRCIVSSEGRLCYWKPTGCGTGWIYQCNGTCG